jgi:hypothetical protein
MVSAYRGVESMSWGSRRFGARGKKKKKAPRYTPYKSALEKRVAGSLSKGYTYEPKSSKLKYMIPHTYTPDFVNPDTPNIYLEVKGYFRTSAEASKYVHIALNNPDVEIIFIFHNANKKAHPNCRPRKDGSILTLHEWCNNKGFLYYLEKELPPEIVKGKITGEWLKQERKKQGL